MKITKETIERLVNRGYEVISIGNTLILQPIPEKTEGQHDKITMTVVLNGQSIIEVNGLEGGITNVEEAYGFLQAVYEERFKKEEL